MSSERTLMLLVAGMVLVIAVSVVIGVLVARRSHDVDDYYERDHEDLPVIGSSYPSGLG